MQSQFEINSAVTGIQRGELNHHLDAQAAEERSAEDRERLIEQQVQELTKPDGDCDPFTVEHFQEAIAQMEYGKVVVVSSFAHTAAKLPHNDTAKSMFSDVLINEVRKYWENVARYILENEK